MAAGELDECLVERLGPALSNSDAPVDGDGRTVAGLEVLAEIRGLGEQVNPGGAAPGRDIGDPVAEQRADVLFAAPTAAAAACPAGRGVWGFMAANSWPIKPSGVQLGADGSRLVDRPGAARRR
jgi:hypothetical protein